MRAEPPRVAWYGDDMTGSIDVLDALARGGVRGVLLVEPPSAGAASRFPWAQAIGWAGDTRTLAPEALRRAVERAVTAMRETAAPILHYKVCSTFDSSPSVGSIGAALDAAQGVLDTSFVPIMPAAPRLGRWCAFSNLFARSGPESPVYRLDRHPTMRSHPSTPMTESDVRRILADQTDRPIGSVDLVDLGGGAGAVGARLDDLAAAGVDTVVWDAVEDAHAELLASVVSARSLEGPVLVVASSGFEHGLVDHWGSAAETVATVRDEADVVLAVCGSRSPVSERQIARAVRDGWTEVPLDVADAVRHDGADAAVDRATDEAAASIRAGSSVIVHTAGAPLAGGVDAGPPVRLDADERVRLGHALGAVVGRVLDAAPVRRIVVAGGDSSGHALRALGVEALEVAAGFSLAMPFCRMHGPDPRLEGVEVVCKGGQTGSVDFFAEVRRGRPSIPTPQRARA